MLYYHVDDCISKIRIEKKEDEKMKSEQQNPLGTNRISKLMIKIAVPSIIAMLVSSIYNIVDQLFIGQAVGTLGNAATNVVFPLTISCTALALLFGIGGASCFNISLGREEKEKAPYFLGNSLTMLAVCGMILCLIAEIFTTPLLNAFGTPTDVFPYAEEYIRITAIGFPFLLLTTGGGHLIRADGSPKMTMLCNLSGAIINVFLDALFVFGFKWGMQGAALATIIGQMISGAIVMIYMTRCKTVKLKWKHLLPQLAYIGKVVAVGMGSFFNQMAMMIVQIVMNNLLKHYGELSIYGSSIPIACAGIVMKVNQLFFSIVIGIAQGSQPIESFNYGAKNYDRVKKTLRLALGTAGCISVCSFLLFQLFPRQILSLFGNGTEEYFIFGEKFMRIFIFFTCINFIQPVTSTFFTSLGKSIKGVFLSMTRQILFLLPLMLVLPKFMGIEGIMYSAPIADFAAAVTAIFMIAVEMKNLKETN